MFNRYYQNELANLRELAAEFSKAHPAAAPMLGGVSSDPDVERLLEGTAFLTGLLRRKLDDEFPEIVHSLLDVVFPHYLKPIPSGCILQFYSDKPVKEKYEIKKGTPVASVPSQGVRCDFQTCFDITVLPVEINSADCAGRGGKDLSIDFTVNSKSLGDADFDEILLYFSGSYGVASDLFRFAATASSVRLEGESAETLRLDSSHISKPAFEQDFALLPYPKRSFSGYRLIQEMFILPQKFLYLKISGLKKWTSGKKLKNFRLTFELEKPCTVKVRKESFLLNTTPIVNLFKSDADPITLTHKKTQYKVNASGGDSKTHTIYSVDSVTGTNQETGEKKHYIPFEKFHEEEGVENYRLIRTLSPVSNAPETFISFFYEGGSRPEIETVSMTITCTNASAAESLQLGDIKEHLLASPVDLEFKNITQPTAAVPPPIGEDALWLFLSHMSMNYLSMADRDNLHKLLQLYIFDTEKDKSRVLANHKRVQGITDIKVSNINKIVRGLLVRGQKIDIQMKQDNFTSLGDMYVFAEVLNRYFSVYSSMNSFVKLTATDTISGESFQWKERLGERTII